MGRNFSEPPDWEFEESSVARRENRAAVMHIRHEVKVLAVKEVF